MIDSLGLSVSHCISMVMRVLVNESHPGFHGCNRALCVPSKAQFPWSQTKGYNMTTWILCYLIIWQGHVLHYYSSRVGISLPQHSDLAALLTDFNL